VLWSTTNSRCPTASYAIPRTSLNRGNRNHHGGYATCAEPHSM
jgi:hypothetical protein